VLNEGPDRAVNEIMIKAYNDWHVDEWCAAYPDRFIPCGILPLFDVDKAAQEVRRLADKGCHAVTFSENPTALHMPSIHSGHWDPLFAACSDVSTVLCCHVGSSSKAASTSPDAPVSVAMGLSSAMSIYSLGDLMWADFWWRFPELKFSLTEGDIGWIPYFLQRAEHIQDRHSGWTQHQFPDGMGPADVFRERILCCFINDPVGVSLIDHFNIDNVCWESDFPHSDTSWPNGPEVNEKQFASLSDAQINKITHENAIRHYSFDPFATRPKERCTAKALRAEAADVDTVTRVGRAPDQSDRDYFKSLGPKEPAAAR
jgi:predicted TIM-barrel fold metal-dependent hydrolase